MIVMKFGGTSVSTKKSIKTICDIVKKEQHKNIIVVVSAMSKVTDALLTAIHVTDKERKSQIHFIRKIHVDLINELFSQKKEKNITKYIDECIQKIVFILQAKDYDKEKIDVLVSFGERMSSHLITQALLQHEIYAQQVIATDVIITDNNFGVAEFIPTLTKREVKRVILPLIKKNIVPVVTGFIGS